MEIFRKKYNSFEDLFIRIIEKHKNDVHNILLYWGKFFLITSMKHVNIEKSLFDLQNEINSFITEPREEKDLLISKYQVNQHSPGKRLVKCLNQGLFKKTLKSMEKMV